MQVNIQDSNFQKRPLFNSSEYYEHPEPITDEKSKSQTPPQEEPKTLTHKVFFPFCSE